MAVPEQFVEWAQLAPEAFDLLDPWEPVPYYVHGELAGFAVINGTEIHVAVSPAHRKAWCQRQRVREFLAPLMERRGYLTTRNVSTNTQAHRFLQRIGFAHTWTDDEGIEHYMLSDLPFSRET